MVTKKSAQELAEIKSSIATLQQAVTTLIQAARQPLPMAPPPKAAKGRTPIVNPVAAPTKRRLVKLHGLHRDSTETLVALCQLWPRDRVWTVPALGELLGDRMSPNGIAQAVRKAVVAGYARYQNRKNLVEGFRFVKRFRIVLRRPSR